MKDKLKQLRIELTRRCNNNCRDCYNQQYNKIGEEITAEEIIQLIDTACLLGLETISLTGGEPLLRPKKLKQVLEYAKSRGLETGLLTNGILATDRVVDELKGLGLDWVRLSLDGSTQEINALTRGNSYDASVQAVRRFVNSGIHTILRTTVHRGNFQDLGNMINLALDLGVPKWESQPYIHLTDGAINEQFDLPADKHIELATELIRAKRKLRGRLDVSIFYGWFEFLSPEYAEDVAPKPYASFLHFDASHINSLHIDAFGGIRTCGCNSVSLGNTRTDSIENIFYDSQYMNDLREYDASKYCPKCEQANLCFPCPAPRTNVFGTVNSANPNCPKVKKGENK